MGLGIFLGILTILVVEPVARGITGNHYAGQVLGLVAGLAVFGYFTYKQYKQKKETGEPDPSIGSGPAPILANVGLAEAFGIVKTILSQSRFGDNWWQLRAVEPEAGQIVAVLNWQEQFGDPIGTLNRHVVLTVSFVPAQEKTAVCLDWDVKSPMNSIQAEKVVQTMTEEFRKAL